MLPFFADEGSVGTGNVKNMKKLQFVLCELLFLCYTKLTLIMGAFAK